MNIRKLINIVSYCWKNRGHIDVFSEPYYGGLSDQSIKHLSPEMTQAIEYALGVYRSNSSLKRDAFTTLIVETYQSLALKKVKEFD